MYNRNKGRKDRKEGAWRVVQDTGMLDCRLWVWIKEGGALGMEFELNGKRSQTRGVSRRQLALFGREDWFGRLCIAGHCQGVA